MPIALLLFPHLRQWKMSPDIAKCPPAAQNHTSLATILLDVQLHFQQGLRQKVHARTKMPFPFPYALWHLKLIENFPEIPLANKLRNYAQRWEAGLIPSRWKTTEPWIFACSFSPTPFFSHNFPFTSALLEIETQKSVRWCIFPHKIQTNSKWPLTARSSFCHPSTFHSQPQCRHALAVAGKVWTAIFPVVSLAW